MPMPGCDPPHRPQGGIPTERPGQKRLLLPAHAERSEHPLGDRPNRLRQRVPHIPPPALRGARRTRRRRRLATQHPIVQCDQVAAKGARKSGSKVWVAPHATHCRRATGTRWASRSGRSLVSQAARSRT